jgi:cytochrome c-type biogenesis protein CcmH
MTSFLIIAAVMTAIAAAVVALPLLRERQSRIAGAVLALLVIGAAAGLYPLWSNWHWHAPAESADAAGSPDVAAMVAKLEKHLHDEPSDLQGWLMLGRSYLALNRLDDGIVAYDHAHRLDPKSADAVMGLGEAMSLRAGGEITPPAAELFEEALVLTPGNPKALLYGGFAAAAWRSRTCIRRNVSSKCSMCASLNWDPTRDRSAADRLRELCPEPRRQGRARRLRGRARRAGT